MSAPHGTYRRYSGRDQCRCALCKRAMADYRAEYRKRRYLNRNQPLKVPALGSQRRMRALQTMGWPLGVRFGHVFDSDVIVQKTARDIAEHYNKHCMTQGPSKLAAMWAKSKGYPPPLAWDNIDDPDEDPSARMAHRVG